MICSELLGDMYSYTVSYWYSADCGRFGEGEIKHPAASGEVLSMFYKLPVRFQGMKS